MPKLTMEDVDKKLEEIRNRRIQRPNTIDVLLERARSRDVTQLRIPRVRRPKL